jgi:hypothetical protein
MPFLHHSDIETQKSQSMNYLGLNQLKIVAVSPILGGILLQALDWTLTPQQMELLISASLF